MALVVGVFQSMGCLLEKIWYLPRTCTVVAFASGMFLFWKILTRSIPKDTYKKVIEHDYLWIWVHLYETILLLGKNCRCQFEVLANSVLKVSVLSPVAMLVAEKGRNKWCCYSARRLEHPFPTSNFLCAVHWYVIPLPFPAVFFFPLSLVSCYFQHVRKEENNKPLHAWHKVCWDEGKQELGLKGLLYIISH